MESCRSRIEERISEDKSDDRAEKAKERIEHFISQKIADGDQKAERDDPQLNEPNIIEQDAPEGVNDAPMETERFEIFSPGRAGRDAPEDELEDGPTGVSERRLHSPVRAPPVKRRNTTHEEEPDTKKIIVDHESNDENVPMSVADLNALNVRREDERIVCLAVTGKNLHDVFSNERITLAVNRQSAEHLMSALSDPSIFAVPGA